MTSCDTFQERLAEIGPEAVDTDAELRAHLPGCTECSAFLANLRQVEIDLQGLGEIDAPDALVAKTLKAVHAAATDDPETLQARSDRRLFAGGLAASVAVAASLVLLLNYPGTQYRVFAPQMADTESDFSYSGEQFAALEPGAKYANEPAISSPAPTSRTSELAPTPEEDVSGIGRYQGGLDNKNEGSFEVAELAEETARGTDLRRGQSLQDKSDADGFIDFAESELAAPTTRGDFHRSLESVDEMEAALGTTEGRERDRVLGEKAPETVPEFKSKTEDQYRQEPASSAESREYAARKSAKQSVTSIGETEPSDVQKRLAGQDQLEQLMAPDDLVVLEQHAANSGQPSLAVTGELNARLETEDKGRAGAGDAVGSMSKSVATDAPAVAAQVPVGGRVLTDQDLVLGPEIRSNFEVTQTTKSNLLARYESMEALVYQEPTGYWANRYIPGDPAMRLLAARLDDWDRTVFGQDLLLEQAVNPVEQPFDAPRDAAVAVYLSADTPSIDGPTRMRVQVGLKGTERQGGRRPAMNIGLVVDLREPADAEAATRIRALIEALERARQPEDRFSLTLAGPDGGLLVEPDQFRHGPIRVAIDRLFGNASTAQATPIDLSQALSKATDMVLEGDDPSAVLGSSLVLLVTGSSLADDLEEVEGFAHRNAVGGVPLSVINFGAGNDLDHIDRLVAAGQGNRRILATAQAAEAVIDRELHAASRAVARALRLRVRLAPGVQLIDVLGSQRLAEPMAQRVREAEQSIDQRLARNLGITADRGDDEDGIQIVIPNFYAGDSHVILLDVVAAGPGPIADVRVRYKDVAHLRNGVAEASLTVRDERKQAGPLERNVLKNLLAWELSRQTRQAGRALAAGDLARAQFLIAALRDEIRDLRAQVAGWPADPGLSTDQSVLDNYVAALASPATANFDQRRYLADSLAYAAFRKLQPIRQ